MRIYFCIIFLCFFICSCSKRDQIPSGILKPNQMQDILWDMVRADVLVQEIVKKDSAKNIKRESDVLNEKIFLIHKISRPDFEKSLSFYEEHQGLLKIIFDSINAKESRQKYKLYEHKPVDIKKLPAKIKHPV